MRALIILTTFTLLACGESFKPDQDGDDDTAVDTVHDTGADAPGDAPDTPTDPGTDPPVDTGADTGADTPTDPGTDGPCTVDGDCGGGLNCCTGRCVNLMYDPDHCGSCGNECLNLAPFCDGGSCIATPCDPGTACIGIEYCCGSNCCGMEQICCIVEGPGPIGGPSCHDGFCPGGCPWCD
jgi:hypothetical protein